MGKSSTKTTTNEYDPVASAKMSEIAEEQQAMAKEYFNFWQSDYKPFEAEQIEANRYLIPGQTALAGEQIASQRSLLPGQTALAGEQIAAQRELLPAETGLTSEQIAAARKILPSQTGLTLEQIASARELLPLQTGLSKETITAKRSLLPGQTALSQKAIDAAGNEITLSAPITQKYYAQAEKGVDVNRRIGEARADVMQSYGQGKEMLNRDLSRMGIDPSSGAYAKSTRDFSLGTSKALAGATTTARNRAEDENWQRLAAAMSQKGSSVSALSGLTNYI